MYIHTRANIHKELGSTAGTILASSVVASTAKAIIRILYVGSRSPEHSSFVPVKSGGAKGREALKHFVHQI